MSREIKFRAFANNYMHPVESFDTARTPPYWFKPLLNIDDGGIPTNATPITRKENPNFSLMQYTGLKDKNGKEIYEGDILEHKPYNILKKVVYKEGYFSICTNLGYAVMWSENTNHLEIIGNIYENPELLK